MITKDQLILLYTSFENALLDKSFELACRYCKDYSTNCRENSCSAIKNWLRDLIEEENNNER